MYSGFASPERESDQRPVNSASGGRIATPTLRRWLAMTGEGGANATAKKIFQKNKGK
jgi:hypothetical protein